MKISLLTIALVASTIVQAEPVCNTLEACLDLKAKVQNRIKELSPKTVTKTSFSGHTFTKVTDRPELGDAWRDESGLIWGDIVKDKAGQPVDMMHHQAVAHCLSINAQLPTTSHFEKLAKFLGSGSSDGYSSQILPGLKDYTFWAQRTNSTLQAAFNGYSGRVEFDTQTYGWTYFRCVAR